jgi:hypothetical protein
MLLELLQTARRGCALLSGLETKRDSCADEQCNNEKKHGEGDEEFP